MRIAQIGPGDGRHRASGNTHPAEVDIGESRCRLDERILVVQLDSEHAGDEIERVEEARQVGRDRRWRPVGADRERAEASGTNRLPEAQ